MKLAVQAAGKGQVVIGSFQGTRNNSGGGQAFVKDYALAACLVKETGAKILEANLSCPNECSTNLVCFDVSQVQKIAKAIKEEIGDTPLILKCAYFESDEHLLRLIKAVGSLVQGIATINTIPAKIIMAQGQQALPGLGRLTSGICGAGIKWAGLDMVKRLYQFRTKLSQHFAIIGVGGVASTQDYREYLQAGADAVMSATGAMWNPKLAQEILEGGKK